MDHGPLVKEEIEEGAELFRRFSKVQTVQAAFWMKLPEDGGFRYLYFVVPGVNDAGTLEAYGDLREVFLPMDPPNLDQFRIKVIDPENPLAVSAAEMMPYVRPDRGLRQTGLPFGDTVAEDLYLYPPLEPVATR